MALERRFRVYCTLKCTVMVDVESDEDESVMETNAAELAERALLFLSLNYPGVIRFSSGYSNAQDVEELQQ